MAEFTGERVIPGRVEPDLLNEHMARYLFAARLARGKRVLDIASGAGYGAAELAAVARSVTGVDISSEAIEYARTQYPLPNLEFLQAPATDLPLPEHSFDLIVAFEVIEHLEDYRGLLEQARRLLTPTGQFLVSTPNRLYYEESRRRTGPNPFHVHEFEFEEFRQLLKDYFPFVAIFLQNHSDSITFQPVEEAVSLEVRNAAATPDPSTAHFFVSVCALVPQLSPPTFVYIPSTANTLRERERHITKLEEELRTKSNWLEQALRDHEQLVRQHEQQTQELRQRNLWAEQLNGQLDTALSRIEQLQVELETEQRAAKETAALYETKIRELEADLAAKAHWAMETERRLSAELQAKCEELADCVKLLQQSEKTVEERSVWALRLQSEIDSLHARLSAVAASRWYRLGRSLGLGPEIRQPA